MIQLNRAALHHHIEFVGDSASNEKLSENGVLADKTMNTLLHVFEAYTELYRVSRDETVGERLRWICLLYTSRCV